MQQSMTGVKDQLKIKVSIIPSESESHYNFLGSSVCSHFFEKRRKIGSFSGNIHLKISAFYDSRSHFVQVGSILNARMPDFLKVYGLHILFLLLQYLHIDSK